MKRLVSVLVLMLSVSSLLWAAGEPEEETAAEAKPREVATKPGTIVTMSGLIDGLIPIEYNEAPMSTTLVEQRKVPPVEERLPEEPLVIKPYEEIGKYGGRLTLIRRGVDGWGTPQQAQFSTLLARVKEEGSTVIPNLAKEWALSDDSRAFTLSLREGLRWSDGDPFTADDILFTYNDILVSKELTGHWTVDGFSAMFPGGELVKVEKIDDYAVRFSSKVPWAGFATALSWQFWGRQALAYDPAHYLKQYHADYNPDAQKLAKEAGFENWVQYFQNRRKADGASQNDLDLPVMSPWVVTRITPDHVSYSRNHYYWKVDTAGNQLPYIDEIVAPLAENSQLRVAKVIAGEPDYTFALIGPEYVPALKMNEEKTNLRVELGQVWVERTNEVVLYLNYTVEDTYLRKLFNEIRFRRALSLSIDRNDINQAAYLGTSYPLAMTLTTKPIFEPRFGNVAIEYDPEGAMRLLDEIGMKKGPDGFRTRPDGSDLTLLIETHPWFTEHGPAAELCAQYWSDIGIRTLSKVTGEVFRNKNANKNQVLLWVAQNADFRELAFRTTPFHPPMLGTLWRTWLRTDGANGIEPPAAIKEYVGIFEVLATTPDEQERVRMLKRAMEMNAENLWAIGVLGQGANVRTARSTLGNVNLRMSSQNDTFPTWAMQWYWRE